MAALRYSKDFVGELISGQYPAVQGSRYRIEDRVDVGEFKVHIPEECCIHVLVARLLRRAIERDVVGREDMQSSAHRPRLDKSSVVFECSIQSHLIELVESRSERHGYGRHDLSESSAHLSDRGDKLGR